MRVLITTCPLYGHFYPMVPLAWALRAQGDDVLVASSAGFEAAANTGLPPAVVAPEADLGRMMGFTRDGVPVPRPADPDAALSRSGRGFGRLAARQLPGTRELVRRYRPDLVISEPMEFAGPIAAVAAGIPWVDHHWGPALSRPTVLRDAGRDELAPELAALGLDAFPDPALLLDPSPPSLRFPDALPARAVRPVPSNGGGAVPRWLNGRPDRPRVCVTLGTVGPAVLGGMELADLIGALAGLEAEVVVAGTSAHVAALAGRTADSVRLAAWLPMSEVVPTCAAIVHHGGAGTMLTALAHRVPQVLLPGVQADQRANAERLHATGGGILVPREEATPGTVRDACAAVLDRHSYRAAARALGDEIAAQPPVASLVPRLRALTAA
ncbi:DUF1205 domain-containing protein [Amycolatopsis sp. NBC_00345]|uniref:nucleotide disphospho-sugar-binding domain-containing protein n=1 Tax=Amycolatopsis sp. NBC_00345 TaxID=2975955 RepID=UPI002E2526F4